MAVKRELILYGLLLGFWFVLAGEWSLRQCITGALSAAGSLWIYEWILRNSGADRVSGVSGRVLLRFLAVLIPEIFISALQHLKRIAGGRGETAVYRFSLEVEDEVALALISNAITLTPGTVTLEAERKSITVLSYGIYPNQCPMDLALMVDRLQQPFMAQRDRRG